LPTLPCGIRAEGGFCISYRLFSNISHPSSSVATPLWPSVGVKPNTSKVGDLESSGTPDVATPLWPSVGVKPNTSKVGDLESSGTPDVATPLWPSVGVKPNISKVGDFESSGTPECLGFDSKAQNTSH
jgi:hypothetical protein